PGASPSPPLSFSPPTPPTAISTLSLHDALPICALVFDESEQVDGDLLLRLVVVGERVEERLDGSRPDGRERGARAIDNQSQQQIDRKSTRLNSSHRTTSYAAFCLKKKKCSRRGR